MASARSKTHRGRRQTEGGLGNPYLPSPPPQRHRTLHELTRADQTGEDLDFAVNEIIGTSDRTACIITAAMLERHLEAAIIIRLQRKNKDTINLLLQRDGALSTFFSKIHLGYAMGLYDDIVRKDLDIIRGIRNVFAHSAMPITGNVTLAIAYPIYGTMLSAGRVGRSRSALRNLYMRYRGWCSERRMGTSS
jgi:hypothetical protein